MSESAVRDKPLLGYGLARNRRSPRGMHADVLLAAHGFWFDLEGKAARQKKGGPNPFIDSAELGRHLTEMEKDFEEALQAQERQR